MFAIDCRSLAAFRIAAAVLILCDLAVRAGDLPVFLTDAGVVPRTLLVEPIGYGEQLGLEHQWSLHLLNGQPWSQILLMVVAAWMAIWLLVGYRTKLAAVASWILLLSLQHRNPLILHAGDTLLALLLFWTLFLPLGACWSLDRNRSSSESPRLPFQSLATAAVLLQLASMYWFSAAFKNHPVWLEEGSAIYYALHGDTFVTDWGLWLREQPRIMQLLTIATVMVEGAGPFLPFVPWKNSWFRGLAIVLFAGFHLGLAATLTLGLFPWICIAGWLLFVPAPFWNWLRSLHPVGVLRAKLTAWAQAAPSRATIARLFPPERSEVPRDRTPVWQQVLVGILFVYVLVWNVREVMGPSSVERLMGHQYNGPAFALGLAQNWSMFAPVPRTDDGWLVMKGTLRDGTEVNLWAPEEPLPWQKPRRVSATFPNSRWRRYLENVAVDQYAFHRQFLCDWLQQRWDRTAAVGDASREVAKVELVRMIETTPPPGDLPQPPEPVELCVRHY